MQISEEASVHHMTIENLATVFAPTIFRECVPEQKPSKKSRSGSQENILSEVKKLNELKVLVIQVLIENAEKIGVPKDCYKATRRPSDLKKKERGLIASSVQKNGGPKPLRLANVTPEPVKKHTTMRSSQSASDLILHVEQMVGSYSPDYKGREKKKTKQQRSNSVVRAFGALKSHFKKSMSNIPNDGFMDTPDPPVLVSKRIPHPESTPVRSQNSMINMDPSASSDEATLSVQKSDKIVNDIDIHMIKKVMSPKDKKKRAPIPNFDSPSSNDEKKENIDFAKSVMESVDQALGNNKRPMGYSNSTNIQRTATQMQRRIQPLHFDRDRRHTAPVNQENAMVRRSSSRRSGSCTSTSSEESLGRSVLQTDFNEILEQKGIEARRRRRHRKKGSNSSMTNLLLENTLGSPEKHIKSDSSPYVVSSIITKISKLKDSETSDNPATSDAPSSPEIKRSAHSRVVVSPMKCQLKQSPSLSVDVHVTQPRSAIAQITPSPDSGCSSISSKQLQSDSSLFVRPKDPVFVKPTRPRDVILHERPSKVNIRSTGTSIMLHTESSRAKCRSPIKRSTNASGSSSRQNSKSPARTKPRIPMNVDSLFSRHGFGSERADDFGRPSIAQIQGTGFVNQRIQQFSKAHPRGSPLGLKSPGLIPKFTHEYEMGHLLDSSKPAVKPAAHGIVWNKPNIESMKIEVAPKLPKFAASRLKAEIQGSRTPRIRVRVGERRQDAVRRAALFQAMSKLSVRSPLKNLQGATPKALLEQTRSPSPNLSAGGRFASIRTRNASPLAELIHRERRNLTLGSEFDL
ncbi:hypothetical protein FO519_009693 [Halicephalobus sp. NKZ332]|nr:hypothetical protein FO519_009693 [Halicephalobus sp. NKZ332]